MTTLHRYTRRTRTVRTGPAGVYSLFTPTRSISSHTAISSRRRSSSFFGSFMMGIPASVWSVAQLSGIHPDREVEPSSSNNRQQEGGTPQ